jgi:hypothetical protein
MWNSTGERKASFYATAMISALVFNSHTNIENTINYTSASMEQKSNSSNLKGTYWLTINLNHKDNKEQDTSIVGISDVVSDIKTSLGLPNKDVAQILRVTRQTLHTYAKNSDVEHAINPLTLKRAFTIAEVIKEIAPKFSQSPGAMAKNYTMEGHTLLELLSAPNLDIQAIIPFADMLAKVMDKRTSTSSHINENALYELTRYT